MKFIANIKVMPLKGLLDPQGKAVSKGLENLQFTAFKNIRIGKHFQMEVEATTTQEANDLVQDACKKLLANPVMEYFEFDLTIVEIDNHACSLGGGDDISDWDVTLMDGLENEPPYVSDDFKIGPDGAYEHIEYSIPIYENGIKTEWTVDGIIGDKKYYQLLELGNGKDLPDMINTTIKQSTDKEQIIDEAYENYIWENLQYDYGQSRKKCYTIQKKVMSKEKYNQIMMEAYRQYSEKSARKLFKSNTYQEFIDKCKTDSKFSENWGLKIEERELSLEERGELFRKTYPGKSVDDFAPTGMEVQSIRHQLDTRYENANIPTKLITLTYNNETIESYE